MKLLNVIMAISLGFSVQMAQSAGSQPVDPATQPPAQEPLDIVSIAQSDESFSTLVTALQAADLVSALQGEGPFTVFAPTNAAFAKLPAGTIEALLADKEKLSSILLYHVVKDAAVDFTAASQLTEAVSANGQKLKISFEDGMLMINDSLVTVKDIQASNGIIHVIDTVLIPE
ncbi:MAG: fasciclin domain-containing protein [Pseudobdellovibrionaceae bacterium]|nr:fasciclin domain-containing protein [Pseudobdellovibrionaceae bacterium]